MLSRHDPSRGQLLSQVVVGLGAAGQRMEPVQTALAQIPPEAAPLQAILSKLPDWYKNVPRSQLPHWEAQDGVTPGGLLVVVTDRQGRIVATLPPLADASLIGTPAKGPRLASLASAALAGQQYRDEPAPGRLRTAQPVLIGESGIVLGSVIVTANSERRWRAPGHPAGAGHGGRPRCLIFALLAGLVGTLFGFLATARAHPPPGEPGPGPPPTGAKAISPASVPDFLRRRDRSIGAGLNFMAADLRQLFQTRRNWPL